MIRIAAKTEPRPQFYHGRSVSSLGLRLRHLREAIEAAAERGETKLLNRAGLDRELEEMRPRDSDIR